MKTSDLARLAFQFLARRKARTLLTVSGVIIGTVCIILMVSIGISNYAQLRESIEGNASLTEIRIYSQDDTSLGTGLTDADVEEMAALKYVQAASPVVRVPGVLHTGVYESYSGLTGISPEVLSLKLAEGKMFEAGASPAKLVVGAMAARDFVDPDNPPRFDDWEEYEQYMPDIDWLEASFSFEFGYGSDEEEGTWEERPSIAMRVCGVTADAESADSSNIYVDLDQARRILLDNADSALEMNMNIAAITEAVVRVDSMEHVEEVLEQLRRRGYDASSDTEYIREMRSEQSRQLMQLMMIGLISLAVSAIGIANTMYAGILERRRDIGIMKVLGMRAVRIRRLFVTEAAVIGLVGGIIGLGISFFAIAILNASMASGSILGMYFAEGEKVGIPAWVAVGAIGTACLTGILAGLWPAAQAARMSPLEAMRSGS